MWKKRTEDAFAPFALAVNEVDSIRRGDPGASLTRRDVARLAAAAKQFTSYEAVRYTPGMPALIDHDGFASGFKRTLDANLESMLKPGLLEDLKPVELKALAEALRDLRATASQKAVVKTVRDELRDEPGLKLAPSPLRVPRSQVPLESPHRRGTADYQGDARATEREKVKINNAREQFSRGVLTLELLRSQTNPPPSGEFTRSDFDYVLTLVDQYKAYKEARKTLISRIESYGVEQAKSERKEIQAHAVSVAPFQKMLVERLLPQVFGRFSGKGLTRDEIGILSEALRELDPDSIVADHVEQVRLVIELFAQQLRELALPSGNPNALSSALNSTSDLHSDPGSTAADFEERVLMEVRNWTPVERATLATNLELIGESSPQAPFCVAAIRANSTAQADFLLGNLGRAVDSFTNRQHPPPGVLSLQDFKVVIAFASQMELYKSGRGKDASLQQIKEQLQPILQTIFAQQEFDGSLSNGKVLSVPELESLQEALHELGARYCVASVEQVLGMREHANSLVDGDIPPPPADENA